MAWFWHEQLGLQLAEMGKTLGGAEFVGEN